jgi:type IV pilus biogenesis protein CpaD/CtpE
MRLAGLALAAALATAGCVTDPVAVEKDFGNSVRQMTEMQTANPSAPADATALDHGDGQRINGVLDAYRKDVGRPADVRPASGSRAEAK